LKSCFHSIQEIGDQKRKTKTLWIYKVLYRLFKRAEEKVKLLVPVFIFNLGGAPQF
jgi:hypothetical protein